jgi:ABC-type transport system involved in multi-copper enzyme maturation permease subunit
MSLVRIWAVASNGFREVIRDRIFYLIAFFSLLLAFALRLLPEIAVGTHEKIFLDLGLASISLFGAIIAIFVGTNLINKEIEKRTVLVLIPKPLSRSELIVGKHLGLTCVLAVIIAAMTGIFLLLLTFTKINYSLGNLLISQFYLLLELALLTAVALTFGSFTSSLLATLLSFGTFLMGHVSREMLELGKITKNENIEAISQAIYLILPDLERLNLKNQVVYGLLPSVPDLLMNALYGIVYTAVLLAIAILIFSRREF